MLIFVAGTGYVSKKAAEDLLIDFIVERYDAADVTFVLPSYLTGDGLRNVKEAIDSINRLTWPDDLNIEGTYWNLVRYKKSMMLGVNLEAGNAGYEPELFMVIDAESEPAMVAEMIKRKVPVYDLSKGLFPVQVPDSSPAGPDMPLDGPESHGDSPTLPLGYEEMGDAEIGSESRMEANNTLQGLNDRQRREVEEIVQGIIAINRPDLHPVYVQDSVEPDIDAAEEEVANEVFNTPGEPRSQEVFEEFTKTKYYKHPKTGKMRKAGKSKARPGEEEAWLTAGQEAAL